MRALILLALVALPAVAAAPVAVCGQDCRIGASSVGYDPTLAILASGSSVVWRSVDITHVTKEQTLGSEEPCFEIGAAGGQDADPVRFDLVAGALVATVGGESRPCANAVATPQGAALKYFCVLHPTMRAAIVVAGTM